jgi:hypothetical protein
MDSAGDEFFSRAGLPFYQHAGIRGGHDLNLPQQVLQCRAFPHNFRKLQLTADFILGINPFLAKTVFGFWQISANQCVLHSNCQLRGQLHQEIDFVVGVSGILALT